MKNAAYKPKSAPQVVHQHRASSTGLTLNEARRVYLQSENRLDLATLAQEFKGAPASVETSGKLPK